MSELVILLIFVLVGIALIGGILISAFAIQRRITGRGEFEPSDTSSDGVDGQRGSSGL